MKFFGENLKTRRSFCKIDPYVWHCKVMRAGNGSFFRDENHGKTGRGGLDERKKNTGKAMHRGASVQRHAGGRIEQSGGRI